MRPVLLQNRAENLLRPQSLTAQCHIHAWQTMGSALRILGKGAWPASPMGVQTNGGPTPLTAGDGIVPLHSWWSIQYLDLNYFIKSECINTVMVNLCTFYALLKAPNRYAKIIFFRQVSNTHPSFSWQTEQHAIGWTHVVMSNPLAVLFGASGLGITHYTFNIICYMYN